MTRSLGSDDPPEATAASASEQRPTLSEASPGLGFPIFRTPCCSVRPGGEPGSPASECRCATGTPRLSPRPPRHGHVPPRLTAAHDKNCTEKPPRITCHRRLGKIHESRALTLALPHGVWGTAGLSGGRGHRALSRWLCRSRPAGLTAPQGPHRQHAGAGRG